MPTLTLVHEWHALGHVALVIYSTYFYIYSFHLHWTGDVVHIFCRASIAAPSFAAAKKQEVIRPTHHLHFPLRLLQEPSCCRCCCSSSSSSSSSSFFSITALVPPYLRRLAQAQPTPNV